MPDDLFAPLPRGSEAVVAGAGFRPFDIALLPVAQALADADVEAFVEEGWRRLVAAGHAAPDAQPCEAGDRVLLARDGSGATLGLLIHRHRTRPARTFIAFGYVRPDARRRGVYSRLYERLVEEARAAGSAAIESEAYPDNEAILACAERQGRVVSRLILQAKL